MSNVKIVKFYNATNTLKVKVDTFEDLWSLQRIIFAGDNVKAETERRFKSSEGDVGELKQVVITVKAEKTELDKTARRLRVIGKIVEGRPLEYVKLNSYHTLNIAEGDIIEIRKEQWPDYLVDIVKEAVSNTKRRRLGIIVMDDDQALPAYVLGYGVEFGNEMYSRLSKRMPVKEFEEQKKKFFEGVLSVIKTMDVDTVIVAGPGFAKDDFKAYIESNGIKLGKELVYYSVSNAERSGVYELIKSESVSSLLGKDQVRGEFKLMENFLIGLSSGRSKYGLEAVSKAVDDFSASLIIVNDSVLGDAGVQGLLSRAEAAHVKIAVISAGDDAGTQLHAFKDIACLSD
ncbi:MAG: mRNA surveillance protein pelota [Candidatus Marsarchaeota archaeon]|jgi:protein pelota|nr:mRNA surveillance protein pelota [Candidatus Marsarchaeota archaeon]MCL5418409.1 mRNA surveillance protein pelota [Candidatus Marsarchaeota archaeon]